MSTRRCLAAIQGRRATSVARTTTPARGERPFGLVDLLAVPAGALADLANAALDPDAHLLAAAGEAGPPSLETLNDLRAHLREG